MKKEYWLILLIFFLFAGPGPSMFFLNQYTVSLLPIASISAILYLLRKEIQAADFNLLIKKSNYKLIWQGLQYCIFAHAVCTLIFKTTAVITDDLMDKYAVMAINIVLIGPVVEEIVYRKIIFGYLNTRLHFWIAAAGSSFLFAAAHLSAERFLAYFLVGIILCIVYRKSNTIYSIIIIHAILNFIPILYNTILG